VACAFAFVSQDNGVGQPAYIKVLFMASHIEWPRIQNGLTIKSSKAIGCVDAHRIWQNAWFERSAVDDDWWACYLGFTTSLQIILAS
jgi:hypothetical protein